MERNGEERTMGVFRTEDSITRAVELLYCTVLYCTVMHCVVLYCNVLH